jgi:thymidine kinase
MPKLYFRHGAVSSAKTLNLLACAHSYRSQGKGVLLFKPSLDVRFGAESIKSRSGLTQDADIVVTPDMDLLSVRDGLETPIHCVLVDECQFLHPRHIEQLREMTFKWDVPVICYGLRTDFRTRLFPGSKRLLELADNIEEIKTTCHFCNKKAILNLKHCDGTACVEGESVQLGCEETYFPACLNCFNGQLEKAGIAFPTTEN